MYQFILNQLSEIICLLQFAGFCHNMFIHVYSLHGERMIIEAEPNKKIAAFKSKVNLFKMINVCLVNSYLQIRSYINLPIEQQRLIFDNQQLDDIRMLLDYNLHDEDRVYLVKRLRGC